MPFSDIDGQGPPRLQLEQVGAKKFRVLRGFQYKDPKTGVVYVVNIDQPTDLASVPFFLTWFIRSYGRYSLAAVLHDYLWRERPDVPLREANRVFRIGMYELKVPFIRCWIMWAAVSLAALSMRNLAWKLRVALWIAAVVGLDLVALWVIVRGDSSYSPGLVILLVAAGLLLLLPRFEVALMGLPTVLLLTPAIMLVLVSELVYLLIEGAAYVGAWTGRRVANRLGWQVPLDPNPPFINENTLQRSDD